MAVQGLVDFNLWSRNAWPSREVAGESFHETAIRSLFPRSFGEQSREIRLRAELVPEPTNTHDRNAIMVIAAGKHVGYLPKEEAPAYLPVLLALQKQGLQAVTECSVWAAEREEWLGTDKRGRDITKTRLSATVRLVLDDWWMIVPANATPSVPHILLPQGSAVQVQKEEDHQEALRPFVRPQGEAWAYGTLHTFVEEGTRARRELVEVRIDGRRVGQLTPAMSAEYAPIIHQIEERGRTTAAKVVVKGNQIKADVVVYAAKTNQLETSWIAANITPLAVSVRPEAGIESLASTPQAVPPRETPSHAPIPPKPTHIRFNPAPGWPRPPEGWEPYPGWTPPVDWPPAPVGWTYWVAVS